MAVQPSPAHTSLGGGDRVTQLRAARPAELRGQVVLVKRRNDQRRGDTDVVRSMSERAGATITEAEGSHVVMTSQPAEVILTAAAAVDRPVAAAAR